MNKNNKCVYCIPNSNKDVKPITVIHAFSRFDDNENREKHTVDKIFIERDYRYSYSINLEEYILATYRTTYVTENKEQILPPFEESLLAVNIVACPKCGRSLVEKEKSRN